MPMRQSTLRGEGFLLRPPRAEDAESIALHANDIEIAANLRDRFPHPYSLTDAQAFIRFAQQAEEIIFVIEVEGEAAGSIGLTPGADVEHSSAELGYWLARKHWGKGLMTRAVEAITEWGFSRLELTRIFARPYVENVASIRVLEKCGYACEGSLQHVAMRNGVARDFYLYAKVR